MAKDIIINDATFLYCTPRKNDIKKGSAAGADDYFTKPFSPLELIKKVEEVLG